MTCVTPKMRFVGVQKTLVAYEVFIITYKFILLIINWFFPSSICSYCFCAPFQSAWSALSFFGQSSRQSLVRWWSGLPISHSRLSRSVALVFPSLVCATSRPVARLKEIAAREGFSRAMDTAGSGDCSRSCLTPKRENEPSEADGGHLHRTDSMAPSERVAAAARADSSRRLESGLRAPPAGIGRVRSIHAERSGVRRRLLRARASSSCRLVWARRERAEID